MNWYVHCILLTTPKLITSQSHIFIHSFLFVLYLISFSYFFIREGKNTDVELHNSSFTCKILHLSPCNHIFFGMVWLIFSHGLWIFDSITHALKMVRLSCKFIQKLCINLKLEWEREGPTLKWKNGEEKEGQPNPKVKIWCNKI